MSDTSEKKVVQYDALESESFRHWGLWKRGTIGVEGAKLASSAYAVDVVRAAIADAGDGVAHIAWFPSTSDGRRICDDVRASDKLALHTVYGREAAPASGADDAPKESTTKPEVPSRYYRVEETTGIATAEPTRKRTLWAVEESALPCKHFLLCFYAESPREAIDDLRTYRGRAEPLTSVAAVTFTPRTTEGLAAVREVVESSQGVVPYHIDTKRMPAPPTSVAEEAESAAGSTEPVAEYKVIEVVADASLGLESGLWEIHLVAATACVAIASTAAKAAYVVLRDARKRAGDRGPPRVRMRWFPCTDEGKRAVEQVILDGDSAAHVVELHRMGSEPASTRPQFMAMEHLDGGWSYTRADDGSSDGGYERDVNDVLMQIVRRRGCSDAHVTWWPLTEEGYEDCVAVRTMHPHQLVAKLRVGRSSDAEDIAAAEAVQGEDSEPAPCARYTITETANCAWELARVEPSPELRIGSQSTCASALLWALHDAAELKLLNSLLHVTWTVRTIGGCSLVHALRQPQAFSIEWTLPLVPARSAASSPVAPTGRSKPSIADACMWLTSVAEMLQAKNAAYGNSALDPLRVFSSAGEAEGLRVRIDDKLSRVKRGQGKEGEDVLRDLAGYLALLAVTQHHGLDDT